jgi:hypothetical protein
MGQMLKWLLLSQKGGRMETCHKIIQDPPHLENLKMQQMWNSVRNPKVFLTDAGRMRNPKNSDFSQEDIMDESKCFIKKQVSANRANLRMKNSIFLETHYIFSN